MVDTMLLVGSFVVALVLMVIFIKMANANQRNEQKKGASRRDG